MRQVFAMITFRSSPEGHSEGLEQRLPRRVAARRRADDHREALDLVHFVEVDLGEDHLLAEAEGVVAAPVEGAVGHALEVAHARQGHVHQPVEELVHAIAAQGHHGPDRHALAQLEVRDRLLGARDHGLLPADRRQLLDRGVEELRILRRLAEPHVEHDLLEARHGQRVLDAEIAHERGGDLATVALAQAGGHAHSPPSGSPQRRQTRSPWPSASRRCPTRVGLLHLGQMGTTLERWIDASFSWMPPGCWTPRRFTCRFTMLTRSISTRSRSASTRNTLPVLPRSLPAMTITVSSLRSRWSAMVRAPPAR